MRKFLIAGALALAACASTTVKSDMATLEVALSAADTAALAYVNLPTCIASGPALCSKPATIAQIGQASATAYASVKTAENVVNSLSASSSTVVNAIAAAQAAIQGFQSIIATLPKTGG